MNNPHHHRPISTTIQEDFSLLTFLEIERNRLKKLLDLFEERPALTLESHSRQLAYRDKLKKQLIEKMGDSNSPFQENIQHFFNQIFR